MGWASWNAYRTDIDEEIILSQAEKLVELGLADAGYIYVNVDDGWQKGRDAEGYVYTHPDRFPSGNEKSGGHLAPNGAEGRISTPMPVPPPAAGNPIIRWTMTMWAF